MWGGRTVEEEAFGGGWLELIWPGSFICLWLSSAIGRDAFRNRKIYFLRDNLFHFFSLAWSCPDLISCHLSGSLLYNWILISASFSTAGQVVGKKLYHRKMWITQRGSMGKEQQKNFKGRWEESQTFSPKENVCKYHPKRIIMKKSRQLFFLSWGQIVRKSV